MSGFLKDSALGGGAGGAGKGGWGGAFSQGCVMLTFIHSTCWADLLLMEKASRSPLGLRGPTSSSLVMEFRHGEHLGKEALT